MGKHLPFYYANDQLEDNHPGCMWGFFHGLNYHQWHYNVKKMLPIGRPNKRKHGKRNKTPKTIHGVHDAGGVPKALDSEKNHFLVTQHTTETSSTHKRSLKARIKALVAEEIHKEDDHKKGGLDFPAQPGLGRTLSIHHLESLDHGFKNGSTEWKNPIIFLPKKATLGATKLKHPSRMTATDLKKFDLCTTENLDYLEHRESSQSRNFSRALKQANRLMQNASHRQLKEYVDVLELFQVNKETFQELQQQTYIGKPTCFHMPLASNTKARLRKSGSFPVADLSYSKSRNFKPSNLKHKQTEAWSFPRGEKSGPLTANDSGSSLLNKEMNSSLQLTEELVDQGCSNVITPSTREKKMTGLWDTSTMDNGISGSSSRCHDPDGSAYDLTRGTPRHRRTSSLNESMPRYARLFEHNFSMKTNWNLSKSLKLTNESEISSGGGAPISFKRNRSPPQVDSCCPLQDEESDDNIQSESEPVGLPVTENAEKCLLIDSKEESKHLYNTVEIERRDYSPEVEYLDISTMDINDDGTEKMEGHCERIDELTVEQNKAYEDQQITFIEIDSNRASETPSPTDSVLGNCFQEEVTSPAVFSASEDSEYKYNCSDERDYPPNLLNSPDTDFLPQSCSTTYTGNLENPNKGVKNYIQIELHTDYNADLNFVREVLDRAGFSEKGFHGAWYSSEQPLSPSIFDEVEDSWWPHESECSEEYINILFRHQLLFDLVNEVILQIYKRSFTYYPRALSSSCRVHSMRERYHDEEVLKSISRSLTSKPELDQPIDDPVTQDLGKDDGWMNLQMESECEALELEDSIFDELLEELIFSWDG